MDGKRAKERVGNDEQGMCVVRAQLFLLAREGVVCQVVRWWGLACGGSVG